jgi:hypothetical protein
MAWVPSNKMLFFPLRYFWFQRFNQFVAHNYICQIFVRFAVGLDWTVTEHCSTCFRTGGMEELCEKRMTAILNLCYRALAGSNDRSDEDKCSQASVTQLQYYLTGNETHGRVSYWFIFYCISFCLLSATFRHRSDFENTNAPPHIVHYPFLLPRCFLSCVIRYKCA